MAEESSWWDGSIRAEPCEPSNFNINITFSVGHGSQSSIQQTADHLPPSEPVLASSISGPSKSSSQSPLNQSSGSDSTSQTTKAEPPVRREHTKSRLGCFNCKRRRIKCPQNHPVCTQCSRKSLTCTWPEVQFKTSRPSAAGLVQDSSQALSVIPRKIHAPLPNTTPTSPFNMQDFRLFNHFIREAHPHHPIGNERIWTHEVPSIAHNHDYLLHAMLALAASELAPDSPELLSTALNHRVRAITLFNNALTRGLDTVEQGNAMLATCYTLIFQSVLIDDGLAEYMTFSRGCVVVAFQMGYKKLQFLFQNFLGEDQLKTMDPHLQGEPDIDKNIVDAAVSSLELFAPLCEKEAEKEFHTHLMNMAKGAYSSSRNAYMAQMALYGHFSYKMSHSEFQSLIDPTNLVGQLLQAHMVALQVMLSSISVKEHLDKAPSEVRPYRSIAWLAGIARNVRNRSLCQGEAKKYFEWPTQIAEMVMNMTGAQGILVRI